MRFLAVLGTISQRLCLLVDFLGEVAYTIGMKIYDAVIVGAGPAGCAAALYIARGGFSVCVLHNGTSALEKAHAVQNYYGTGTVSGAELFNRGLSQLAEVGAEVVGAEVVSCSFDGTLFHTVADGEILSEKLVVATGAARVKANIEGVALYEGKGVSYCAVCDAFFYRKKKVAVLGAGEFARHELGELSAVVGEATLLTDGENAAFAAEKVDSRKIARVLGENGRLTGVEFTDGAKLALDGLFVAKGMLGGYSLAKMLGAFVDGDGIKVDERRMTALDGLYAVGDCTAGIKQVSKAVCDGMTAGVDIVEKLRNSR